MSKSIWKFSHVDGSIYKNIFLSKFKFYKILKIFSRKSTIPQIFSKKNIQLYKGNIFTKINFTKYNVGYKIGEFNITRKPFSFPKKKKK
jgi:ribosomal protein S19